MTPQLSPQVEHLLSPRTIRERCEAVYALALKGGTHFRVDEDRIGPTADLVAHVTRENYPDLRIPVHSRWGHFRVGGVDRVRDFEQALAQASAAADPVERARAKFDLVITSVLLDAGAGMKWKYVEERSRKSFSRSEGLAVASYHLFRSGAFAADPSKPLRADAEGLAGLTESQFKRAFQISEENPIVGLKGRLGLLHSLAGALRSRPEIFGKEGRVGNMVDYLLAEAGPSRKLPAPRVLRAVQVGLGSIWPGRVTVDGFNLGDVWPLPLLGEGNAGLVPFHKLSQWLTYSLFEPLAEAGLEVTGPDELTGLPEYRNGGLFYDLGVISLRKPELANVAHAPGSPLVVEWRALTVALLDRIAEPVRERLDKTAAEYPLGKVLEGGTWWAGRRLAAEKRADGGSPLKIDSDGTVF